MPGTVHVKVVKARDLPVMDKRSELTDAFVEIKMANGWNKTEVCPKTLHPKWNSQWYKFNVTDEELQDEPLQLKVMDHDIYSAHDAIGRVYIVLNSLVECGSTHSSLEGWFPIFDTLHGVRGELYVEVKLDMIQDQQRFKQSSFGVQFYSCTGEPEGMAIHCLHGFVEELVVNDDPEYQWIDRLRTPRSSNEARQRLFSRLSGELRRRIGARALEVEANAILGYKQSFDIEGESGLVVRGIGTCVSLIPKLLNVQVPIPVCFPATLDGVRPSSTHVDTLLSDDGALFEPLTSPQHSHTVLPPRTSPSHIDGLPPSPSKTSGVRAMDPILATSSGSGAAVMMSTPPSSMKHITAPSEYPFYTISTLPDGVLTHIGALVTARSVKLLDKINNPDDPETRDAWWMEVRDEMRSHLRVLGCAVIIGYSESTSICDSLCVFSATGTAVTVTETSRKPPTSPGSETELKGDTEIEGQNTSLTGSPARSPTNRLDCSLCHLPYSTNKLPVDIKATFCRICRSRQVPSLILSTSGLPTGMPIRGRGCLVQARVCVAKRKMKGEENAYKISKELPFLEYEMHSRLLNKVYVHGMNAVFGLKIQVSVGDTVVTGLATGTAVYLEALPPPPQLTFHSKESNEKASAAASNIQVTVDQALKLNRKICGLLQAPMEMQVDETGNSFVGMAEDTPTDLDLTTGKKDVFLVDLSNLEIDGGNIHTVVDRPLPEGYLICNLSSIPGTTHTPLEGKMVTIVKKTVFQEQKGDVDRQFSELLLLLIQTLCFKVRTLRPCTLTDLQFDIDLPEDDEIQVSVTAVVVRSHDKESKVINVGQNRSSDEFIFDMDEGHEVHHTRLSVPDLKSSPLGGGKMVLMTPSPFITGWTVQKYLGRINVFLIRESTSIRESGGIGIFSDLFLLEANSIVRANVKAVGGNAILGYQLNKCVLIDHHYKNQVSSSLDSVVRVLTWNQQRGATTESATARNMLEGERIAKRDCRNVRTAQCLLDISGDAVQLVRTKDNPHTATSDSMATAPTPDTPQ